MMMLLPQHDAHCIDRKYQDAAAFGREMADKTIRYAEDRFASARTNIEAMRRVAPGAFRGHKPHLVIVKK